MSTSNFCNLINVLCLCVFTMQTAKINQGNIALRRVVESIANGDSHVPFRDSKLTMLLQVYKT